MRVSSWRKRLLGFKRRVVEAFGNRVECVGAVEPLADGPDQPDSMAGDAVSEPTSIAVDVRPQDASQVHAGVDPSVAADDQFPLDIAVADSSAIAPLGAPVATTVITEISGWKSMIANRPGDESSLAARPRASSAAPVLDRLVPSCGVQDNGIWLPQPYVPDHALRRRQSPGDALGCSPPTLSAVPEIEQPKRLVAIADSENAITPVTDSLRYLGLLKKSGALQAKRVAGLEIVHTGDMILKHQPDYGVVRFWQRLGEQVEQSGGNLVLLAGNHELEIWRSLRRGDALGLKRRQRERVLAFIMDCRLFYVAGSVLFLHGYPTVNFLQRLRRFQVRTGLPITDYNEACFRPALEDLDELDNYRYLKGKGSERFLLHDVDNAGCYYRRHGKEVSALLRYFEIEQVVHGHRPERSGVQADHEFGRWLPGIRMIGNDTQLRERGLGAVAMRVEPGDQSQVHLVNTKSCTPDLRRRVKQALRAEVDGAKRTAANIPVTTETGSVGVFSCYRRAGGSSATVGAALP